jgi:hypothetical protein
MKVLLIIAAILAGLFLVSQLYMIYQMRNIEYQEYQVIEEEGDYEIRYYPEAILASTTDDGDYKSLQGKQFGVLAGYIFGGNTESQKIAMTSPVAMEMQDQQMKMSFVMPSEWSLEKLPETTDNRITFEKTEPKYVAAVRFGGFANEQKIEKAKNQLITWLENNNHKREGHFSYLGYNPPWQTIDRRNEVIVALRDYQRP